MRAEEAEGEEGEVGFRQTISRRFSELCSRSSPACVCSGPGTASQRTDEMGNTTLFSSRMVTADSAGSAVGSVAAADSAAVEGSVVAMVVAADLVDSVAAMVVAVDLVVDSVVVVDSAVAAGLVVAVDLVVDSVVDSVVVAEMVA